MKERVEKDALGEVRVPENALFGSQTARSLENFSIGREKMPEEVLKSLVLIKRAAAIVNAKLGRLSPEKERMIIEAAEEILSGKHLDQFPLSLWQTGSGTQSNMNVNEVIANLAIQKAGGQLGSKSPIHPNDDVNMSQSSNDVFPTAMHLAAVKAVSDQLLPALHTLKSALEEKANAFSQIIKIGRTHLMDATPLTLGQEFSGYASQVEHGIVALENTLPHLLELAIGGTAVGTGLNAPKEFGDLVAKELSKLTGFAFVSAKNRFEALAASDALVEASGALKRIAASFMKIANDIRWLASGPRSGLGEIRIPENEPGSSIMPGKVNPTQSEALTMVSCQVLGNDATIGIAGSLGNFELNVFRPVIIYNFLQSVTLLAEGALQFTEKCVVGIEPNEKRIKEHLERSLMLATALNQKIGYDAVAKVVRKAYLEECTLKEAAASLGLLTDEELETLLDPKTMIP